MRNEKKTPDFDLEKLTPQEQLKYEIAAELGLDGKVRAQGWRSLTAKESGKIGGLMTKRRRQEKTKEESGEKEE